MTDTPNLYGLEAHRALTEQADVWDLVDPNTGDTVAALLCADELEETAERVIAQRLSA